MGSNLDHKLPNLMFQTLWERGLFKPSQIADPVDKNIWGLEWCSANYLSFKGEDA